MKILSGKQLGPRRIMLYGVHGVGKSTWAAQSPNPIFLNLEDGLNDIDCSKTELLGNYLAVMESVAFLQTQPHEFKTLVIDTIDWLEQLIYKHICQETSKQSLADFDYGKGYEKALAMWKAFLVHLDWLRVNRRMNVILLAHAKIEKYQSPEVGSYDRYIPKLHESKSVQISSMVQEWADEVFFASFKTYVRSENLGFKKERNLAVGGKERVLRTGETAFASAKNRLNLPEEIPMDWSVYLNYVKANYATAKKVEVIPPQGMATIETPSANIAGVVVDGSSKKKEESPLIAEMENHFGNATA